MCVAYPAGKTLAALSAVRLAVLGPVVNRMWIIYLDSPKHRYYWTAPTLSVAGTVMRDEARWHMVSGPGTAIEKFPTRRNAEMEAMKIVLRVPQWTGMIGVVEIQGAK